MQSFAVFLFSLTAFLENLNFLVFPFSSIITNQTLVGFSVKGHRSIALEASIAFSILRICPGVVPCFLICFVTTFTHSTRILFVIGNTLSTFPFFHLSLPAIITTVSSDLIFIIFFQ
jgi:hypothetical protein